MGRKLSQRRNGENGQRIEKEIYPCNFLKFSLSIFNLQYGSIYSFVQICTNIYTLKSFTITLKYLSDIYVLQRSTIGCKMKWL